MLDIVQNFPLFCIILMLFSGVICSVLSAKTARNLCIVAVAAVGVMNACVLQFVCRTGHAYIYKMGHFPAPWGNEIRIGVLEALLAIVFSIVMILSLLGGLKHIFEDVEDTKINLYFLMVNLLFCSMLALIYTNDLFTGYVFVEINTIAACAIVMLRNAKETLVATARYLVLSLLGSGMFLLGICILYDITGHLLMSDIHQSVAALAADRRYTLPLEVVIALFCVGMATKSALFPFHSWLPDAHGSATTSSSSILSGLVLKGYIILLIKIMYRVIGLDIFRTSKAINVLFVLGCSAMIAGSLSALREKNIKRMIAFSSVAQIGYIYLGIGLGTNVGIAAAFFQIIAHALTKPMLFSAAGGFMEVSGGSRNFAYLYGAARRNLLAGIGFVTGSLSMIGIPLFAGFISKYYLASAAASGSTVGSGRRMYIALAVLAISTLLNALYYIPAIMVLFAGKGAETEERRIVFVPDKTDHAFILAMILFIGLNLAAGCCSTPLMNLITQGIRMFA